MKTLRAYQQSAVDTAFDFLMRSTKHGLVVAPVGSGKSVMIAELIKKINSVYPRTRIVLLSHVKELLVQDANILLEQDSNADVGFYCASLNQKRLHNDITMCSIQSVHKKIADFNRCPEIIVVDEAHLISHNDQTLYRKFIDSVVAVNKNVRVIGFTGTPFRCDTGRLDEGNGRLFDEIAYEIGIKWMIDNGYLCKPVVPSVETKMDVDGVATRNGDYVAGQLEAAVDIDELTKSCVKEMIEKAGDRKKWLIFTAGIQHCEHVRDALRLAGVSAEMVIGDTPPTERDEIISRYKAGKFTALVNVAVLTTGFDCPDIDMLAFMRPTKSPVLYIQCIGRGLRIADGKENCLILDFGRVIEKLGPIDELEIRKGGYKPPSGEIGAAVMKRCPACGAECSAAQRYCYECSYNFINESLSTSAEKDKQVLSDAKPVEHKVLGMVQKLHKKDPNKPATMQVTYSTMYGPFKEWICFEHGGYARDKAVAWHMYRTTAPVPATVEEALKIQYQCPKRIKVIKDGKYWRIIEHDFFTTDDSDDGFIPITTIEGEYKDITHVNTLADIEDIAF